MSETKLRTHRRLTTGDPYRLLLFIVSTSAFLWNWCAQSKSIWHKISHGMGHSELIKNKLATLQQKIFPSIHFKIKFHAQPLILRERQ